LAYFQDIKRGIGSTVKGLSLTLRHLRHATKRRKPTGIASDNYFDLQNGLVTLQYPHEQLPIPDNGRYRLHNEMDDCIVCDKCAKVCPVDCITIEPIKATGEVGRASDGSPIRLYAATFDIDMAKCCFCGLCTVVCPTECLTMEKTFDFSTVNLTDLNYSFANLTPEQADEKRALYAQFVQEKEAQKVASQKPTVAAQATSADTETLVTAAPAKPRPVFRPTAKPVAATQTAVSEPIVPAEKIEPVAETPKPKPAFRPTQRPVSATPPLPTEKTTTPTPPVE
jgi:formate hydrogenlyase subunit 6/NADH:ubiquinone oxidoreductase subunit I